MAITFDGPTLTIGLDTVSVNYTAQYIYSRWKEWVLDNHANWPPAFRVVGGDDLGGGSTAPAFFFVRNDLGWTIKRPESTIDVTITGNLVFQAPDDDLYSGPDGDFSPTITVNLSSVAPVDMLPVTDALKRLLKAYGMVPGSSFQMPPAAGGPVLEDGEPIADVGGDCETGFTVTGRSK